MKSGRNHRRVGHGLNAIEPTRNREFLRLKFLSLGLALIPFGLSPGPILQFQK
jgi:hypothetical protein